MRATGGPTTKKFLECLRATLRVPGRSLRRLGAPTAPAKVRAYAGMFAWPCPRNFYAELSDREAAKVLEPADV